VRSTFVPSPATFVGCTRPRALTDTPSRGGNHMRSYRAYEFDNRDSAQMYDYLEARIDAMKRRITELEMENARLTCELRDSRELMPVCA
jgi:hypothetical protein